MARALFTLANDGEEPDFDIKVEDAVVSQGAFFGVLNSGIGIFRINGNLELWGPLRFTE